MFGMFTVMYGRRLLSSIFAITEGRDMDLYEVPLSVLCFRIGDYVSQLPYLWYYVIVKSRFEHDREECPGGPMCFRYMMFNLLGSCEWLFLLFYCLYLSSGEWNDISLYFLCCSVNGSVRHVSCLSDSVCIFLGETISNILECGYYFVV